MIIGFGNNTVSSLAADITANQATIQVMPGEGAKFAKLLSSDYVNTSNPLKVYAKITLTDAKETVFEVCHLTAVNNDMLTVVRGQEGTTAKGWALNDVVANFATRGSENQFIQIEQLQSGNYTSGVAGGSANALTIELPATYFVNSSTEWALRTPIIVYPTQNNTGASTLQLVMGGRVLGTFPLYKGNKTQLVANDILKDVGLVCLMDKTKTFFNVANPGAIYAGLGSAAFKDVVTSMTDTTTGRVPVVGWMGLGGNSIPIATTSNADLSKLPGIPFNAFREYKSSDGSVYLIGISGISPSGNLVEWLAPENGSDGKKIAVRNKDSLFVLYSTGNKPTASDVGAIPFFGQIPAGTNLNTLTSYGVWFNSSNANATLALNYPGTNAGSLQVLQDAGSTQIYTEYQSGSQFRRGFYAGTWSPWRVVYDSGYKPTPDDVNAIAQDGCRVAGFVNGSQDAPYMRHTVSNSVIRLLPANGNAVSATKLQTARTINGVAFDGTANINISASQVGSYTKAESDSRFQLIVPASGAVGTYAYARVQSGNLNINFGNTVAASVLTPACGDGSGDAGGSLSGTWRCCGRTWGSGWPSRVTLWIRIA